MRHDALSRPDGRGPARGGRADAPAHPRAAGARGAGGAGAVPGAGPEPAARLAPPEAAGRGRPGRALPRRRLGVLPPGRRRPAARGWSARCWPASIPTTRSWRRDAERLDDGARPSASPRPPAYFAENAAALGRDPLALRLRGRGRGRDPGGRRPGPVRPAGRPGHRHGPDADPAGPAGRAGASASTSRQQMLNIARANVAEAGLEQRASCATATSSPPACPSAAPTWWSSTRCCTTWPTRPRPWREAARLVAPGGRLLIVDFAPHKLEFLREQHQHRRLGFSDDEMRRWLERGRPAERRSRIALPPTRADGLTVKIWTAQRAPQPPEERRMTPAAEPAPCCCRRSARRRAPAARRAPASPSSSSRPRPTRPRRACGRRSAGSSR